MGELEDNVSEAVLKICADCKDVHFCWFVCFSVYVQVNSFVEISKMSIVFKIFANHFFVIFWQNQKPFSVLP